MSGRWKVLILVSVFFVVSVAGVLAREAAHTQSFPVKKGGKLVVEVDDAAADIEVRIWNKNEVRVEVDGISEDDLEDLEMSERSNTVYVEYQGRGGWSRHRHMNFMVSVPSQFDLELGTAGGDIEVDGMIKGIVQAATSGGDIEVEDVDGELELRTSGGDVTAGNVTGDAELGTSGGDIEIGDVDGELDAKTAGGDIEIGKVGKDLDAKTAGGDIMVGDVGGIADVSTAGGDIELGAVSGTARVKTAGGDIVLESATGRVTAQTAGGDIELENITGSVSAETAGGDIIAQLNPKGDRNSSLETAGGDIELYIPANAKVTIEARIRLRGWHDHDSYDDEDRYQIYSDFKATNEDKDRKEISAEFVLGGGGPIISLETMNGDIYIRKMEAKGSRSR